MRQAKILENSEIARASRWLVLQPQDTQPLSYEPGNVLALHVGLENGTMQHHAYTVTACDTVARTFTLLYRVIPGGRMTPRLESLQPDSLVHFEGKYHNPIAQEISENARAIVGISTGTGIGPLYGFAKKVLKEGYFKIPITLYAGFREMSDICLSEALDQLAASHTHFAWHASLSQPGPMWEGLRGRVTQSVPPRLGPLQGIHFHLVGNGSMVEDFCTALIQAKVPESRISTETYFNWNANFNEQTVAAMLPLFAA